MDPIPAWVKRLWDSWDVQMLVLLSLSLQIILFIFGKRRKYISSQWISIVVWLAYLMADWVAAVALGKLSDAQMVDRNNALRAIWAPLLLLHLGGPDTITAYSLEDNQLWGRHFMGLCVHVVVAVYVILISWRNSGFYFLSFPVLEAGTIKYGERTWVLKSVCNDKLGDIVPLKNILGHEFLADNCRIVLEGKFLYALIVGRNLLATMKRRMGTVEDIRLYHSVAGDEEHSDLTFFWEGKEVNECDHTYVWEGLEVEMGLMYDLYYTKAPKTYTKGGCILRSISFACMMPVLVGFFWLIFREVKRLHDQQHGYHSMVVDMAITGLLLVGAVALEIYALVLLISSDWAMLWLIKQKRQKLVIQLGQKLPWLFPMLRKKRWSKMMGQFDLLAFRVKKEEVKNNTSMLLLLSRRVLRLFGIQDKFDTYMHKTCVDIPTDLYSMISHYLRYLSYPDPASAASSCEEMFKFVEVREDFEMLTKPLREQTFDDHIIFLHAVTETFYTQDGLESNINTSETISVDMRTCRSISHYLMYLYITNPSLLPVVSSLSFERVMKLRYDEVADGYDELAVEDYEVYKYWKEKQAVERWRTLKSMWLGMICYAAINVPKSRHLQQLRQGNEFLTVLWFFIGQCHMLNGFKPDTIFHEISNQVKSRLGR